MCADAVASPRTNASRASADDTEQRHMPAWAPAELVQECGSSGAYQHERQRVMAMSAEAVAFARSGICPGITLTRGAGSRPVSCYAAAVAAAMETAAAARKATTMVAAAMDSILVAAASADDTRGDGTCR